MDFIQFARCRERYRNLNQTGTHKKITYLNISLQFVKKIESHGFFVKLKHIV